MVVLALVVAVITVAVFYYTQIRLPNQRFRDRNWMRTASEAERLRVTEQIVSFPWGNHHDAFLYLFDHGNAGSVPALLSGLRWNEKSVVCTKSHCLGALQKITNHDMGPTYGAWAKWWDSNAGKTREEWILDGFRVAGLPVSVPPDEESCRVLVRALTDDRFYVAESALDILADASPGFVVSAVEDCMASKDASERMAAVTCLASLPVDGRISSLRTLGKDQDEEVREAALAAVNELVRTWSTFTADVTPRLTTNMGESITAVAAGPDDSHLLIGVQRSAATGRSWHLILFDEPNAAVVWEAQCPHQVNCFPVVNGGRIFLTCTDGTVGCLDAGSGEWIWKRETEGHPGLGPTNKVLLREDRVFATMQDRLWAFRRSDGEELWKLDLNPLVGHAAMTTDVLCTITDDEKLVFISPKGDPVGEIDLGERALGLSAEGDTVFVISGEDPAHLTAYSVPSLSPVWRKEIGKVRSWPQEDPVFVGDRVLACADDRIVALDRRDGSTVWSVQDRADSRIYPVGEFFVIRSRKNSLEIRDGTTGETLFVFPEPRTFDRPMLVTSGTIATGDMEGNLWVIDMPVVDSTSAPREAESHTVEHDAQ